MHLEEENGRNHIIASIYRKELEYTTNIPYCELLALNGERRFTTPVTGTNYRLALFITHQAIYFLPVVIHEYHLKQLPSLERILLLSFAKYTFMVVEEKTNCEQRFNLGKVLFLCSTNRNLNTSHQAHQAHHAHFHNFNLNVVVFGHRNSIFVCDIGFYCRCFNQPSFNLSLCITSQPPYLHHRTQLIRIEF